MVFTLSCSYPSRCVFSSRKVFSSSSPLGWNRFLCVPYSKPPSLSCFAWTVELLKLPKVHPQSSGYLPSLEISGNHTESTGWVCGNGNPRQEPFGAGTWVAMGLLGNSTNLFYFKFVFPMAECLQQCCLQAQVWVQSVLCSLTALP